MAQQSGYGDRVTLLAVVNLLLALWAVMAWRRTLAASRAREDRIARALVAYLPSEHAEWTAADD